MPTVEGAGVELAYEETAATGPAVVLVHGMAADRAVWAGAVAGARTIAYDRRGYGDSGAPEPYERTTVSEQAEDLVALLRATGAGPALAAGADFGALVVLDVLRRHPGVLRGAVLVGPPVFQLVPTALEPLSAERLALEDALREGGRDRAVERWLELHGAAEAGAERLARARRDATGFFADYGGQATLPLARRDLRSLGVPVVVLDPPGAPAHVRAAGDAVAALIPGVRRGGEEDVATALAALL
jgi:pimeloyl-ACP methyl ester carboxylesterase